MRSRIFPIERAQEPEGMDTRFGEDLLQNLVENLGCLREMLVGSLSDFLGILDVLEFLGLMELLIRDRVHLVSVRKYLNKNACSWAYGLVNADD